MVKKILTSLATLTLIAGSVTSATAWTQYKTSNGKNKQNQKPQSSQGYNITDNNIYKKTSFPKSIAVSFFYAYKNVIYAGALYGLYESTDNGKTFNQNKSISTSIDIVSIYAYNNVIYVGTQDGIYESTDNGKTFNQNKSISTSIDIVSIYAYNNVIYVGTQDGIYESTDNGKKFILNTSTNWVYSIYSYDKVVYAGTFVGLLESTDNGKTFTPSESFTQSAGSVEVNSIYSYDKVIYLGTDNGLYESTDNGKNFMKNILFTKITSDTPVESICALNNVIYFGTSGLGLCESTDNGKTFTLDTAFPGKDTEVFSISSYNNTVYFGLLSFFNGQCSLYETGSIISSVNKPNKEKYITNEDKTYDYLIYSSSINFTFDWTLLSKVTIVNNSTTTPTTKTLTSGSYQIKDDGNYTVTFSLKNGKTVTKHFLLKNGYDFSQGINAATYDSSTSMLDIYFSQAYVPFLEKEWYTHGAASTYLLDWIRDYAIKGGTWSSLLSPNISLDTLIEQFIPTPPKEVSTFKQIDPQITFPSTGAREDDYAWGLQNKVNKMKPTKGLVLKLKMDIDRGITQTNSPTLGELPLTPKTSGSAQDQDFQTNYWDQVLFNQN